MMTKKKLTVVSDTSQEKSYRIRWRNQDQLSLVKDAAKHHGKSFNSFVVDICERAAHVVLRSTPTEDKLLSSAVNEALSSKE